MTSPRKLERDFARADMAAVSSLLDQLGDEDVMARFGLEARLQELQTAIAQFGEEPEDLPVPELLPDPELLPELEPPDEPELAVEFLYTEYCAPGRFIRISINISGLSTL